MAKGTEDEELLKRIRDDYSYLEKKWRKAREERKKDLRYLTGDPWEPKDRKEREDSGRPCLSHDELRQYVNAAVNSMRMNKRGINVDPDPHLPGDDPEAAKQEAELRQDIIRTVEYNFGGPSIYVTSGFENAIRGGYGYFRIGRRYVGKTFEQELTIKPILNPDSVLFDWDCREIDWSDGKKCFVLEWMTKDEFKARFPKAEVMSFTAEHRTAAPNWINEDKVLVAEYWTVDSEFYELCLLETGEVVKSSDLKDEDVVKAKRDYEERTVMQRLTNGVEILEEIPQPGEILPIIPSLGEEIWIDRDGAGAERELYSIIRFARDPQMTLAYLVSQEAEEAGLSPKAPFIGYAGQFETNREAWEACTKQAVAFLEADPVVDGASGQVLPLPNRVPFTPNFPAYEVAKEAARRAIQAAMGISPLPTAAQRQNEKSGIALQRIQQQQEIGSFHFVDNFDRALRLAGRVMDSWINVAYAGKRDLMLRKANDTSYLAKINTDIPYIDDQNQEAQYKITDSQRMVTINSGPSYQSQQQEMQEFLNSLLQNMGQLPLLPQQKQDILARVIRMKNLGVQGDDLADSISPSKDGKHQQLPPEVMQKVQQMQQQLQALNAYGQQKEAEIAELQQKLQAKVVDNAAKAEIERMRGEIDIAKAEIGTKAQILTERVAFVHDLMQQLIGHAHEAALQQIPPVAPAALPAQPGPQQSAQDESGAAAPTTEQP